MTLSGRIKIQMAAQGIKGPSALAQRLSKQLGREVHRQKVKKWLDGDAKNMELDAFFALSDVLKCSARWLAIRDERGPQKPVFIDIEKTRFMDVYDELKKAHPRAIDKWLRQGRDLLELAPQPTPESPFHGTKATERT